MKNNYLLNVGLTSLLALAISACGKSNGKKSGGKSGLHTEINRSINGENAKTYYDKFLYKLSGTCMSHIYHQKLFSYVNDISLDTTSNGNKVVGNITVFLEEETYIAKYSEHEITKTDGMTTHSVTLVEKEIEGTWSVDGLHIKLDGLGTGYGIKYNGKDSLMFKLDGPIESDLKSNDVILSYVTGTHGLKSMRELCPDNYQLGSFSEIDSERNLPAYPLVALKATLPNFGQSGSTMYFTLFIFDDENYVYNYTYVSNGERFSGKESGSWRNRGDQFLELSGLGNLKLGPYQSNSNEVRNN